MNDDWDDGWMGWGLRFVMGVEEFLVFSFGYIGSVKSDVFWLFSSSPFWPLSTADRPPLDECRQGRGVVRGGRGVSLLLLSLFHVSEPKN